MKFKNRQDAGEKLAKMLTDYQNKALVLALPRGGVLVGSQIARRLNAPMGLIMVKRISHPKSNEYGIGAVAEDGHVLLNRKELAQVDHTWFLREYIQKRFEARKMRDKYMANQRKLEVEKKTVIIVDDGVATGFTIKLAINEVRHFKPNKVILALPVVSRDVYDRLISEVDSVVALDIPKVLQNSISNYYQDFHEVDDEEVIEALQNSLQKITIQENLLNN